MVTYRRSYDAIKDVGRNIAVLWRPDSTALAVTVSFVLSCSLVFDGIIEMYSVNLVLQKPCIYVYFGARVRPRHLF